MKKLAWFVGIVVVLIVLFNIFTFSVDETKNAIVVQYGDIKKVVTEPGLYFKLPFIQNVQLMEDRLLSYDIEPRRLITADQRRLSVNNYAIWRIEDPKKFRTTMAAKLGLAQTRIDDIVYSNLRNVMAEYDFSQIASSERMGMLEEITKISAKKLEEYGINLLDVRVKRADLPEANEEAVYERMKSERYREASRLRAEGEEKAKEIRSEADKESRVILAEAKSQAEEIRGTGEARALDIYSSAYGQEPAFYEFWRTLESYKRSLGEGQSTILLSPRSDYLQLLEKGKLEGLTAVGESQTQSESASQEEEKQEAKS